MTVEYVLNAAGKDLLYDVKATFQDDIKTKVEQFSDDSGINKVALIHKSEYRRTLHDDGEEVNQELVEALKNYDLLILLIQDHGPAHKSDIAIEDVKIWDAGTDFIIRNFDRLHRYLNSTMCAQWEPDAWYGCSETIIALYLLDVAAEQSANVANNEEVKELRTILVALAQDEVAKQFQDCEDRPLCLQAVKEHIENCARTA